MLVEPGSLCWVGISAGEPRDGQTWAVEFARFSALSGVVRDDGSGLGKGLKLEQRAQHRAAGQPDLEDSLDIFHTFHARVAVPCGQPGARPAAASRRAEAAQKELDRLGRAGESRTGHATRTSRLWRQAKRGFVGSGDGRREGLEADPIRLRVLHARRPLQRSATGPGGCGGGGAPT